MVKTQNITREMKSIYSLLIFLILFSCKKGVPEESRMTEEVTSYPAWITTDYVMGKFDPASHDSFVLIDKSLADREGLYLREDVYRAYKIMQAKAEEEGVRLVIRSATRNFDYQKGIWERKWTGKTPLSDGTKASDISDHRERAKKILLYSSMPGSSRHHWGTDIDLNSFDNSYFEHGEGLKIYEWLKKHAATYGFCQPYTDKAEGRTGYEEERWHWTFVPVSSDLTKYCSEHLSNDLISGFLGSEVAADLDIVGTYVLGIGKDCF